jgi:hypothetical protein
MLERTALKMRQDFGVAGGRSTSADRRIEHHGTSAPRRSYPIIGPHTTQLAAIDQ